LNPEAAPADRRLAAALGCAAALAAAWPGLASPADGARIARLGLVEKGAPACASCHGMEGQGVAAQNGPRLAHLDEDYLTAQMEAFASGARASPVMAPIVRRLTDEQRALVAGYFAGLPTRAQPGDGKLRPPRRGQVLAEQGDWSLQAPPCAACHGPNGVGVGAVTPPLAGQSEAYLAVQLARFRDGGRRGDALGLMRGVARRLSPADLQAVASYYASLPVAAAGAKP
jgi:cytochrome c553